MHHSIYISACLPYVFLDVHLDILYKQEQHLIADYMLSLIGPWQLPQRIKLIIN